MYLVTAATTFEMRPFLENLSGEGFDTFVTGVGPFETILNLAGFLNNYSGELNGVITFGVGGAYVTTEGKQRAGLLDICLAETEVFGDFGVCLGNKIEPITGKELEAPRTFDMDAELLGRAVGVLRAKEISFYQGHFVTVSCATGTLERGTMLEHQYRGLCENMEGAAVARVCQEFDLPCLEIRCISNLVEDRDTSRWQLKKACKRSGEIAATIVKHLVTTT